MNLSAPMPISLHTPATPPAALRHTVAPPRAPAAPAATLAPGHTHHVSPPLASGAHPTALRAHQVAAVLEGLSALQATACLRSPARDPISFVEPHADISVPKVEAVSSYAALPNALAAERPILLQAHLAVDGQTHRSVAAIAAVLYQNDVAVT